MAGLRFIDLYSDAETITNVTGQRAWVKRLVNQGCAWVAGVHEWPFLWTNDFFSVVASYTTGKVSVNTDSAVVTGSSTVFDTTWTNRKIRFQSETAYYTIKSIDSTTQVTLDQNYIGTSNLSAVTYTIFRDEYYLRADVDQPKLLRQASQGVALLYQNVSDFDQMVPTPTGTGPASFSIPIGRAVSTYTTGTVSMTSGSRIITGAGSPSWNTINGIGRGTKIQIGSVVFTIRSVDSATQLTVYEAATAAIVAGTSYTILLDNLVIQLYTIPVAVDNYYYRFQRIPAVLDADQDMPDLPHPLHPLILLWVLPWLWSFKGFPDRQAQAERTFFTALTEIQGKYSRTSPDQVYRRADADKRFGRRFADFPTNEGVVIGLP